MSHYTQREACHSEGISLSLKSINYPNYNVKANWFTAAVKVKELNFGLTSAKTVEVNAFNSTALKSVVKLVFPFMDLDPINKGIFNGLESLKVLVMDDAYIKAIQKGVLDVLSETLTTFTVTQSSKYWSEILIDGFTGSEPLKALEYVKYNYNLKTTITHKSFVGLQNVKTLDLSDCQIVTIGAGAFDPISNSIVDLNLKNNAIKTLPEGLFNSMLPNAFTTINLDGNKWDCQSDLCPLKMDLMENSNFVGTVKCSTPSYLAGLNIIDTDFCDDYVPPSTTQTTLATTQTTPPTTSISSTTTDTEPSIPDEFRQECYEAETDRSKIVSIKTPRAGLTIHENENGDVIAEVDKLSENSILIWFSSVDQQTYYSASDEITCAVGATNSIPINNIKEETAYTFCLMDSTEKTVSPLDCISYTKGHAREKPWLLNDSKGLVVSMIVVACGISVFTGLAIGMFALKAYEIYENRTNNQSHNACINEVLKETFQTNSIM